MESFTSAIQTLMKTDKDFPKQLKQRLVLESHNLTSPFKFIVGLFTEGVLNDGSSDTEASVGLKEMMVQLAMMLACSKGADAIGGLAKALEDSGNLQLISSLRAWVKEDFGIETDDDLGKPEKAAAVQTKKSKRQRKKKPKNQTESSSIGTKLIDHIMSYVEDDFMEQLEAHWVSKADEIVNASKFCSSLVRQMVLDEAEMDWVTRPEVPMGPLIEETVKTVCSKRAIGSLVTALQHSGNENILQESMHWLQKLPTRSQDCPVTAKILADQRKLAMLKCQQTSVAKGISLVQFVKKGTMASSADGTLNLWNWGGGEEDPIKVAAQVKNITCFQCDEEILVLGTTKGTVHLFDARTFEEKCSVAIEDLNPVTSLKFFVSNLVVTTRSSLDEEIFWLEISRQNMQLLNQKFVGGWRTYENRTPGVCMTPDATFVYYYEYVHVYDLQPGREMIEGKRVSCYLWADDFISTLNVGDLKCTNRVVVAGCINGAVLMWKTNDSIENYNLVKTFNGHTEAIVSLCFLNGHLLGLDTSGKILMWSGHDLENKKRTPVPHVLTEKSDVTSLTSNECWFSSGSSKDDIINIWTLPDLWLRIR